MIYDLKEGKLALILKNKKIELAEFKWSFKTLDNSLDR